MKKLLFVLISLSFVITGLSQEKAQKIKDLMWNSGDKDFEITEAPEKWNGESAVILCKSSVYEFKKPPILQQLNQTVYFRKRVLLLDNAAISNFSEFSFESYESWFVRDNTYVGIKVIKPDGTVNEIDTENTVEMNVYSDGSERSEVGSTEKKIAIPNLEKGDIVDFYYVSMSSSIVQGNYFVPQRPVYQLLAEDYPIVKQKIMFKPERKCYINLASMNGAPEAKQTMFDEELTYIVEDQMREKYEGERWFYHYRELPYIKFQNIVARNAAANSVDTYILGEVEVPMSRISKKDILNLLNALCAKKNYDFDPTLWVKEVKDYIREDNKKERRADVVANKAYHYIRHDALVRKLEKTLLNDVRYNSYGLNDYAFIMIMSNVMQEFEIPHEVGIGIERDNGELDDILIRAEITPFIKYRGRNGDTFIFGFDLYSIYNEIPHLMEGTEAYVINPLKKKKERVVRTIELPVSEVENNTSTLNLLVTLEGENFKTLNVKRNIEAEGFQKGYNQGDYLTFYDIINKDYRKYDTPMLKDAQMSKKKKSALMTKINDRKKQEKENRIKTLEESAKDEFEVEDVEVAEVKIKKDGRWSESDEFEASDRIKITGLTSKAGKNFMIDAGKLIGSQVSIKEEDYIRDKNIWMPCPRQYTYKITIVIPEGYEVKGVDKLNYDIQNSCGGFKSTASMAEGKIVINARKHYNNNYETAENWGEMLEFLNAAYDFSQQKLLLKKL